MRLSLVAAILGTSAAFVPSPSLSNLTPGRTKLPVIDFQLHVASTRTAEKKIVQKSSRSIEQKVIVIDDPSADNESSTEEGNALVRFSTKYQQLQKDYYLQMAFLQAGVLASGADMATQTMEAASIDFGHVAAMATVASSMSGAANAIWLKQLEAAFPGTETREVAYKTLIHAIIIASIINSAYLAFVPLLTTYLYHSGNGPIDLSIVFAGWSVDEFITLTKLEVLMFIPYNTLAFKYVPPSVRPLTHAAISATFNVAVSAVTLGYFNRWCENAMHLFS